MNPNIKQYTTSKAMVCFVNVPWGATHFKMFPNGLFRYRNWHANHDTYLQIAADKKWQLIDRISQVSEEQAAGMVDSIEPTEGKIFHRCYTKKEWPYVVSAQDSLYSLARSLNIPENQDPVILVEFK